jgi:integrase
MDGPPKAAYYLRLRRWELNPVKRGDLNLGAMPPEVCIPDSITKNFKPLRVELHPELAAALRGFWRSDMSPFGCAFYGRIPNRGAWRRDLAKAGICFENGEGRRLDSHSLRHTLCTHLRIAGVSKRDAKQSFNAGCEMVDPIRVHLLAIRMKGGSSLPGGCPVFEVRSA